MNNNRHYTAGNVVLGGIIGAALGTLSACASFIIASNPKETVDDCRAGVSALLLSFPEDGSGDKYRPEPSRYCKAYEQGRADAFAGTPLPFAND